MFVFLLFSQCHKSSVMVCHRVLQDFKSARLRGSTAMSVGNPCFLPNPPPSHRFRPHCTCRDQMLCGLRFSTREERGRGAGSVVAQDATRPRWGAQRTDCKTRDFFSQRTASACGPSRDMVLPRLHLIWFWHRVGNNCFCSRAKNGVKMSWRTYELRSAVLVSGALVVGVKAPDVGSRCCLISLSPCHTMGTHLPIGCRRFSQVEVKLHPNSSVISTRVYSSDQPLPAQKSMEDHTRFLFLHHPQRQVEAACQEEAFGRQASGLLQHRPYLGHTISKKETAGKRFRAACMGSPLRERCVQGRRRQGEGTEGQEGVGGIDWCCGKSAVQTKSGTQRGREGRTWRDRRRAEPHPRTD